MAQRDDASASLSLGCGKYLVFATPGPNSLRQTYTPPLSLPPPPPNHTQSRHQSLHWMLTPQVAPYPFTTLQPHLGAVSLGEEVSLTVADIPGLLPGAARNRGLGHAFLRHVSRARALVYVVDASGGLEGNRDSPRPWEQLHNLQAHAPLFVALHGVQGPLRLSAGQVCFYRSNFVCCGRLWGPPGW